MEIIVGPRGIGKTRFLVRKSAEFQIPIVCHHELLITFIEEVAKELNLKIPKPIFWKEIINDPRGLSKEILIDDADCILNKLFEGNKIKAITMSNEYQDFKP